MNRQFFGHLVLFVLILLIQTTLGPYLTWFGAKPDLFLLVFIASALRMGAFSSQFWGFVFGLSLDMLTLSPVGFHTLLYTVLGFVFGALKGNMFVDPLLMPLLLALGASFGRLLLVSLLNFVFALQIPWAHLYSFSIFLEVVYNLVLAPLVFFLHKLLFERLLKIRRGFDV